MWILATSSITAAGVAYAVLLFRLLASTAWQPWSTVLFGIILLGTGYSAVYLNCVGKSFMRRYQGQFAYHSSLFALTALVCLLASQSLTFHPELLMSSWRHNLSLLGICSLLLIPFICVGTSLGIAIMKFEKRRLNIIAWSLMAGGVGAVLMILGLNVFSPVRCLLMVSMLGLLATTSAWLAPLTSNSRVWILLTSILMLCLLFVPEAAVPLQLEGLYQPII